MRPDSAVSSRIRPNPKSEHYPICIFHMVKQRTEAVLTASRLSRSDPIEIDSDRTVNQR